MNRSAYLETGEQECTDYDGDEDFYTGINIALRLLGSDCGLNGNSSVLELGLNLLHKIFHIHIPRIFLLFC